MAEEIKQSPDAPILRMLDDVLQQEKQGNPVIWEEDEHEEITKWTKIITSSDSKE